MMENVLVNLLREMRIDPTVFDADELIDLFISEMDKGLAGQKSSLPMIPAYIGVNAAVPHNEPVIVIDAGGTNLRVCLMEFDEAGVPQVSNFTKVPMPGTQGELSADRFYSELVDLIAPIADKSSHIGFCFSYPADIQPDLDGRLLHWTKEVRVPELVGACVAKGLKLALKKRGLGEKQIVILNDTVACLLAGRAQGEKLSCESFIGFILGTGSNTAYVEQNVNILKVDGLDPEKYQVINVESGGFGCCVRGPLDLKLDQRSQNPGGHVFEKMLSGVYLGELSFEVLKAAVEQGVLSESTAKLVSELEALPWIDVNTFMHDTAADSGVFAGLPVVDREVLGTLFSCIIDRAALLTAVNISAAAIKSGKGLSAEHPLCINIDGSTYYKTFQLAEKVQAHLSAILGARGIHYTCVHVEDAPVVGAAIAGLTAF